MTVGQRVKNSVQQFIRLPPQEGAGGFSLLEVLIVLGIVSALAALILPNLGLTPGSQMNHSLRDITTTLRATYDDTILSGRVHRVAIVPKTGAFWVEQAPLGYEGRPPLSSEESASDSFNKDARVRLKEELDKIAADKRKAEAKGGAGAEQRFYSSRSILVAQRRILDPIKWSEIDDTILYKRELPSSVVFAELQTDTMRNKLEYANASEKDVAYIYFFPSGEAQQATLHIATKSEDKTVNETGPKFTINLDPLSGHSELLEGFQDAEFVKDSK